VRSPFAGAKTVEQEKAMKFVMQATTPAIVLKPKGAEVIKNRRSLTPDARLNIPAQANAFIVAITFILSLF
jgi:hypothetical protein